jgi:putative ABC transport system substrate-binding protein
MASKRRLYRRHFIAAPLILAASKAQAAERMIGWISPDSREAAEPFVRVFKEALAAGARPGSEPVLVLERFANDNSDAIPVFVSELQRLGVRLIVSQGAATLPVVRARPSVPVVFGFSADPVVAGIAQSFARPGGMVTGVSFMSLELNPKRIDLVREALVDCQTISLLSYARHAGEENEIIACQQAADKLALRLNVHRVQGPADVKPALFAAFDAGAQAIVMLPSALMVQQARAIAAECIAKRVALVSGWSSIARAGALMTYGPKLEAAYGQVASYVLKVLDGADVAGMPIEQPSVFELVINLRTAKALGLTIPPSLYARSDEMIE